MNRGFLDILNLAVGILCLFWGIIGRGYPYKNNYPKKIRKFANKLMRICLLIAGPSLLGNFAVSYFCRDAVTGKHIAPWYYVDIALWVVGLGAIVAYIVILYSKYGKEIKASVKAQDKPKYYKG